MIGLDFNWLHSGYFDFIDSCSKRFYGHHEKPHSKSFQLDQSRLNYLYGALLMSKWCYVEPYSFQWRNLPIIPIFSLYFEFPKLEDSVPDLKHV